MPGPCSGKNLISIFLIDYIQKRRCQALLFSFEYNLLPNLISNFNHYIAFGDIQIWHLNTEWRVILKVEIILIRIWSGKNPLKFWRHLWMPPTVRGVWVHETRTVCFPNLITFLRAQPLAHHIHIQISGARECQQTWWGQAKTSGSICPMTMGQSSLKNLVGTSPNVPICSRTPE